MKKIYLDLKVSIILNADDDINIGSILDGLDVSVTSDDNKFDVTDCELKDANITDVK
jgi:hypothetical protein